MIVKIKDKLFDSENEPIMIILNDQEKELISNMGTQTKFCVFPENYNTKDVEKFMKQV